VRRVKQRDVVERAVLKPADQTTGHDFGFPATDASGHSSASVDTGRPRGGYDVVWTVTASAAGSTASTTTSCYAP